MLEKINGGQTTSHQSMVRRSMGEDFLLEFECLDCFGGFLVCLLFVIFTPPWFFFPPFFLSFLLVRVLVLLSLNKVSFFPKKKPQNC